MAFTLEKKKGVHMGLRMPGCAWTRLMCAHCARLAALGRGLDGAQVCTWACSADNMIAYA